MSKLFIGIDVGSRTTKIACLNAAKKIIYTAVQDTGLYPGKIAETMYQQLLKKFQTSPEETAGIYATGYGRYLVKLADKTITEITCHARGVHYLFPESRTIIDIGGQDSKSILVNSQGKVTDFVMNDKCAAGTGRFLEVVSTRLGYEIADLSNLAESSSLNLKMNNTCVVFAESEIIGMLAQSIHPSAIASSVINSIAERTVNLLSRLKWSPEIIFTGGVAKNSFLQKKLTGILKNNIKVPENPFITGAIGAALLCLEEM